MSGHDPKFCVLCLTGGHVVSETPSPSQLPVAPTPGSNDADGSPYCERHGVHHVSGPEHSCEAWERAVQRADELSFVRQVMFLFDSADVHSEMFWRVGDDGIRLFANVSDVFMWGCADVEDITPERLPVLQQAYDDLASVDGLPYLAELYGARIRCERPQGAAYPDHPNVRVLLDACGPERDLGLGNPKAPAPLTEPEGDQRG